MRPDSAVPQLPTNPIAKQALMSLLEHIERHFALPWGYYCKIVFKSLIPATEYIECMFLHFTRVPSASGTHSNMIIFLFSLLLLVNISLADPEQFSVPYSTIKGSGWASNLVWALGSKQTISWNTTLSNYNITLWQQSVAQNKAKSAATPALSKSSLVSKFTRYFSLIVLP